MSRTVHHVSYEHRLSTHERDLRRHAHWSLVHHPTRHRIRALRYSAAVEAVAAVNGHRPRPEAISPRLEAYTYPRTHGGQFIAYAANRQERALRAADRIAGNRTRQAVRGALDSVEAAWEVDYPDPRHRHFAVWDSW